jgi:hypothetical protein
MGDFLRFLDDLFQPSEDFGNLVLVRSLVAQIGDGFAFAFEYTAAAKNFARQCWKEEH